MRRAISRLCGVMLGVTFCSPQSENPAPSTFTAALRASRTAPEPSVAVKAATDQFAPTVPHLPQAPLAPSAPDGQRPPSRSAAPLAGSQAGDIWRQWQRLVAVRAYQQLPIVAADLAESLQAGASWEVYGEIENLLADGNLDFDVRAQLVELLGEIATPDALSILLKVASRGTDSPLYAPALNSIAQIGDNHWGGRFHEELSPLLEDAWQTIGSADHPLLLAVARAIVGIGAPSGMRLMIDSLLGANPMELTKDEVRRKQFVAFTEIPKVTNPAAVPTFRDWLAEAGNSTIAKGEGSGVTSATAVGSASAASTEAPKVSKPAAVPRPRDLPNGTVDGIIGETVTDASQLPRAVPDTPKTLPVETLIDDAATSESGGFQPSEAAVIGTTSVEPPVPVSVVGAAETAPSVVSPLADVARGALVSIGTSEALGTLVEAGLSPADVSATGGTDADFSGKAGGEITTVDRPSEAGSSPVAPAEAPSN